MRAKTSSTVREHVAEHVQNMSEHVRHGKHVGTAKKRALQSGNTSESTSSGRPRGCPTGREHVRKHVDRTSESVLYRKGTCQKTHAVRTPENATQA